MQIKFWSFIRPNAFDSSKKLRVSTKVTKDLMQPCIFYLVFKRKIKYV